MVEHALQHDADRLHALRASAAAHGIDLLLRRVQDARGSAAAVLHHGGDLAGSRVNRAHERLVAHDVGILHHVCGGRRYLHELNEIVSRGILVVCAVFLHLARDSHPVDRLGVNEHAVDRLKDLAVLPQIKVVRTQLLHHVLNAVGVDKHRAEHRLLRFKRMRHLTVEQFLHDLRPSFASDIARSVIPRSR